MKIARSNIINALIDKFKYESYLEIGFNDGRNFSKVKAKIKEGIDPSYNCTYRMTSDNFFKTIPKDKKYDIIFVDGLHLAEQTERDIVNSLQHLNKNGTIVIHDCNPMAEKHQSAKKPDSGKTWLGTVWKAFASLRISREDLFMCVIPGDCGCGIIRTGKQSTFKIQPGQKLDWKFLEANRKELLNIMTFEEFMGGV